MGCNLIADTVNGIEMSLMRFSASGAFYELFGE